MFAFLAQIAIAIVLALVAYMLAPKPKAPKPSATRDMEAPTAEAGRPCNVVFGEGTIKSPNCLWYGQVSNETREISV